MAHEKIQITIDSNGMYAKIRFHGSFDPSVTYSAVFEALNEKTILFGIDTTAIQRKLEEFQNKKIPPDSFIAARGYEGRPAMDGRIELFIAEEENVTIDESGHADYRNIKKFNTVEKGQLLARLYYPKDGETSINIFGAELVPREPVRPKLDAGQNVSVIEGSEYKEYFSEVKGVFRKTQKSIEVDPVLRIKGSVGIETGNIRYDGDVEIRGNIERGSSVIAKGNIHVGGIIESGEIRASGSLYVNGGINTKGEGRILVKQGLEAGYIDNAKLFVDGDLFIDKSITICNLITHGNIFLKDPHSSINGGEIMAYGSINANTIGNRAEIPTIITLGVHYERNKRLKQLLEEFEKIQGDIEKIGDDIQKLKIYVQRMRNKITDEKKEELRVKIQEYTTLTQTGSLLEKDITDLKQSRFNNMEVEVTAREMIFPGVQIHYRGHIEKITAPMSSCILTFSPDQEKPKFTAFKN